MLQMVRKALYILLCAAACSCNNQFEFKGFVMPTGDGVEKRFEQSKEMNPDLKIAAIEASESYVYYVATDPHVDKTHRNLSIFNDALKNDAEAAFGAVLGDCGGKRGKLPVYLKALTCSIERHAHDQMIFHVLGNHDTYFRGWDDFKTMIGPSVYWFEVVFPSGKDLYITLDTATGTLGRSQTEWLKSFLNANRSSYRHCVVLTHTNFFYTDMTQAVSGNMPIDESLVLVDFLGRQKVSLVLQGHDHHREDLTYDNVRYTVLGAILDSSDAPEYLKITASSDGLDLDWQYIETK